MGAEEVGHDEQQRVALTGLGLGSFIAQKSHKARHLISAWESWMMPHVVDIPACHWTGKRYSIESRVAGRDSKEWP
jgi:hypothetical protein